VHYAPGDHRRLTRARPSPARIARASHTRICYPDHCGHGRSRIFGREIETQRIGADTLLVLFGDTAYASSNLLMRRIARQNLADALDGNGQIFSDDFGGGHSCSNSANCNRRFFMIKPRKSAYGQRESRQPIVSR
jgi:hypothetical protein